MTAERLYQRMIEKLETKDICMLCIAFSHVVKNNERNLFHEINDPYYNSLFKAIDRSPYYRGFKKLTGSWFEGGKDPKKIRIDVLKDAIRIEKRLTNGG